MRHGLLSPIFLIYPSGDGEMTILVSGKHTKSY